MVARYALDRPPKQTYIDILLKVSLAIEITIEIDESALAATLPVQGGRMVVTSICMTPIDFLQKLSVY